MDFKKFDYCNVESINRDIQLLGLEMYLSERFDIFKQRFDIDGHIAPNRLAIHPMEGADSNADGSPGPLTMRRYERFSKGGAGIIWFEAVAVVHEARTSPRQLWINRDNVDKYKQLMEDIVRNAQQEFGANHTPVCIMQLTHSGRFSKPEGKAAPVIAAHNPFLDARLGIDENYPVIEDDDLERLEDKFVEAAILAKEAGFHGVDVKACHRYLNSELLSAHTRKGRYGGDYENRTRFLLNVIDKIKDRLGDNFIVSTRLNIYDGIPYPYGWGVAKDDYLKYDLTEPVKLTKQLYDRGVKIINVTMGTPYYNPHVNRPFDKGEYITHEHPLKGVARLVSGAGEIQKAVPGIAVVGTGYSWLREFSVYLAAGMLEKGMAAFIGYGRESFAYPDFAKDIIQNGFMKKEKCCIACGKCTEIMRAGGTTGCVIRDSEIYGNIYSSLCKAR